ncbi:MAG: hypothetical protein GX174_09640 [Lentisphaerae bacterium]|nr:hypothetical protein [Lentisphaerota bacterium]
MSSMRFNGRWCASLCAVLWLLPGVLPAAAPVVRLRTVAPGKIPAPAALAARVEMQGRTSRLIELEIAALGPQVPRTFSRHLIGNTAGFDWYVSRHFALKTDLPQDQVRETLTLLELGLPQLEAIFGDTSAALADRRMAFVFASSRAALRRAMADDDLHVLNLGGITQEGFWGAYQYAGSPYQNRYIILHEFAHLFQYALVGSARYGYGFFVEGIADFFSSHVYDPERQQLTVNVLDRAPMHNHLAAGLAEWQRRECPSLSTLYAEGAATRGVDVLVTAFLQSSPEREMKWRLYCREILQRGRPDQNPRQLADELMAALYGDWETLDRDFRDWMERLPSFVQLDYGFDQHGEWLISQNPLPDRAARMRLNPPPLARPKADAFTLDYPRSVPRRRALATTNAFSVGFTLPALEQLPDTGRLELQLGGETPLLSLSISNRLQVALATPASNWCGRLPSPRPAAGSGAGEGIDVRLDVMPDEARLKFMRRGLPSQVSLLPQGRLPLTPGQFAAIGSESPELVATVGGFRVMPWFWEEASSAALSFALDKARDKARDKVLSYASRNSQRQEHESGVAGRAAAKVASGLWRPLASRFGTSEAAGPVFRALHELGNKAPDTLRIAGHMLLADAVAAPGAPQRLPVDELESKGFWQGLAAAVQECAATPAARRSAMAALADVALDLALAPPDGGDGDMALVRVRRPGIGTWHGRLSLWMDGLHIQTRNLRGRNGTALEDLRLPLPATIRTGVHTVKVRIEAEWLGQTLVLERRLVANPGIPRWHVVGPFLLPDGVFTNSVFAPELEKLDLQALFPAPDGTQMHWQSIEPPPELPLEADHLVHFTKRFRRQANFAVAYAVTVFESEASVPATLALGVSDGVQIWLNGECLLTDVRPREWTPGNVRVPVTLARGTNTLLVKSLHADGLWFLSGRIEDRAGNPLRGIGGF